jgi:hypothetical protein
MMHEDRTIFFRSTEYATNQIEMKNFFFLYNFDEKVNFASGGIKK